MEMEMENWDCPYPGHLNPLQIDGCSTNGLSHLDGITCAVLTVGGGQMQQIRPVRRQQGVRAEVRAEATRGQHHGAELLDHFSSLPVLAAHHGATIPEKTSERNLVRKKTRFPEQDSSWRE